MNAQKCSGCPNNIKGVSFLRCCRCSDKYHHTCVNINKKDFDNFNKNFKESWVCPSCRCKEPKLGDNTNTPIRCPASPATPTVIDSLTEVHTKYQHDNVTLRSKPRGSEGCNCLSADLIRDIIREELDKIFNTALKDIQSKLDKFEESLAVCTSEYIKLNQESESQRALIEQQQNINEQLRTANRDLTNRLQHVERLSRANNLEIQCVPEHNNESLYTTIQQLGNTIKCPVTDSDIQYCTRIAKFSAATPRPRSILVKFNSRRLRDTFLAGVIKFNRNNPADKLNTSHLGYGGKKSAVYVTEHLTPEAKVLHAAALRKAKEFNYRFVWVRDGKVFLRKTENSNFILVKDMDFLNKLNN